MSPPAECQYMSISAILFADEGVSLYCAQSVQPHFYPVPDRPRIITVKCRPPTRPSHSLCPIPLLHSYFDESPRSVILRQGLNGEFLRFPLHVFYSPMAVSKGSPINRSIYYFTSGVCRKPWCGNVVALKFDGSRRQSYTEAGSNDFPALSAYFLSSQ